MNYQWYPGHMTKAVRQMREDLKLVDMLIEIIDARIPVSSRNPEIDELGQNKARLILLNKIDLADPRSVNAWSDFFTQQNITVCALDSRNRAAMKVVNEAVRIAGKDKLERDRRRGIKNRPIRAMVCGIPNVGKSTFINSYAKKAVAKTGNKPGVTKGKQWIRMGKELELLDTPGILWPKFDDPQVGLHLAFTGAINDEIYNREQVTALLVDELRSLYPGVLGNRFHIDEQTLDGAGAVLEAIARKRGCLIKGGDIDMEKAERILLTEFRAGKLGTISLEQPDKNGNGQ